MTQGDFFFFLVGPMCEKFIRGEDAEEGWKKATRKKTGNNCFCIRPFRLVRVASFDLTAVVLQFIHMIQEAACTSGKKRGSKKNTLIVCSGRAFGVLE